MKQPQQTLVVIQVAYRVLDGVGEVIEDVRKRDRGLEDQLKRACQSVVLNLAEAVGNRGGNRRLRLETALGSAYETAAALRIARAWRYVDAARVTPILVELDRVAAMTYRWRERT